MNYTNIISPAIYANFTSPITYANITNCPLIYGQAMPPYWIMLFGGMALIASLLLFELIVQVCCIRTGYGSYVFPKVYMVNILSNTYIIFLLCNIFYQYILLILLIGNAIDRDDLSNFEKYEMIYSNWLSGGILNLISPNIIMRFMNPEKEGFDFGIYFLITLIPVFITHILPMMIIYCWIVILLFILLCIVFVLIHFLKIDKLFDDFSLNSETVTWRKWLICVILVMIFKSVIMFILSFSINTMFNYAMLLYRGHNYIDLITTEYDLHDTSCWFDSLMNSLNQKLVTIGFL